MRPEHESKSARFRRVAEARVNKAIKMLDLLGNCAKTNVYEYSEEQVEQIFSRLLIELRIAREKYECANFPKRHRFTLATRAFEMPEISARPLPAIYLEWSELETYLTKAVSALVDHMVPVEIDHSDPEFWPAKTNAAPLSESELEAVFSFIEADADDRDMMGSCEFPVAELVQSVVRKLLRSMVPFELDDMCASRSGLWLYGYPT